MITVAIAAAALAQTIATTITTITTILADYQHPRPAPPSSS